MRTKFWFVAIFVVLAFVFMMISPAIGTIFSTSNEFNVTDNSIFLNYTNGYSYNITVGSNTAISPLLLTVFNATTTITPNYTQGSAAAYCSQLSLFISNRTGTFNNFSIATKLNQTLIINFSTQFSGVCYPGRYYGGLTIANASNSSENATINVTVDAPISLSNILGTRATDGYYTGVGNQTAVMSNNSLYFHRYYFNTSELKNATSITLNLSAAQDIDIFLFNATTGKFLAKSINKSNSVDWLTFWPLEKNSIYEIRIYGNITNTTSTPYNFYMMFSSLNLTNSTGTGQLSSINFGNISVSGKNITNITLKNEGNLTLNNVVESKELYYVKRWEINTSSSSLSDGLFLVPPFATKIRIAVNWTNVTQNYSIYLTAPNRTLISSSNGKFLNANFTNASLEEYIEINENTKGYWNASVRHNTGAGASNYTLAAFVWYPVSDWISTNYTTMTFNTTGNNNFTTLVNITFTVPNNSIDGKYEGFIQYTTAAGAAMRIPFNASVNASSLIVNETLNAATVQIDENIGANLTKVLNITMNNSGSYPLSFTLENSTNNSFALWNGAKFINFSYQVTSSPLSPGAGHVLNITMILDPNTTKNVTGIYEGYIKFVANESRPYQNFTLTLRVNLTDDLNVSIVKIISEDNNKDTTFNWINFTSAAKQVMAKLNVYYINSTQEITSMNTSNFTTAWLTNANISYRIPTTGNLTIVNYSATAANPIYCTNLPCPDGNAAGFYYINTTVPANQPGGIYQLHIGANYTRGDGYVFKGEGVYNYLYINQTGLYMEFEGTSPSSMSNATTAVVNVSVKNYGSFAASAAKITLTKGSGISSIGSITKRGDGCTDTSSDTTTGDFTFSMGAYNSTGCVITWNITSGTAAATAVSTINGTAKVWFNSVQFTTTVSATGGTSGTSGNTDNSGSNTGNTTPTSNTTTSNISITNFPTEIRIVQNTSGNATITVKNSGDVNLAGVKVYVDGINQSWYVRPAAQDISKSVEKNYSVIFNVPASASPVAYSIKYVANNSNASKSVSASLLVIPNNQTAAQIASNLSTYAQKYEEVSLLLNQTRAKGANVTDAEATLKQAKDLLDKAEGYVKTGDYFNAYQLIDQIDSLIKTAEAEITEAVQNQAAQSGSMWMWIGIFLGVGVAGAFIFYIALPPKKNGFMSGSGYQYNNTGIGKSKLDNAKMAVKRILAKLKKTPQGNGGTRQSYAFNQSKPGIKGKLKGIVEKIKNMFRRKQSQKQSYSYKSQQPSAQPFVYKGPPLE